MSEATVTPEPVILTGASGAQYELGESIGSFGDTQASECDAPDGSPYYGPGGTIVCRCIVCSRCGHHTGNNTQGHFWAFCSVTKSRRDFHLCCPGNCELEASKDATRVQIPAADVNESASELQSAAEPLHITAALAKLAELRDTFHLPHPRAVRMTKSNGIGVVEVSSFAEVVAWAQTLGHTDSPNSIAHDDGASSHSVWVRWKGWDVRVGAWIDAPLPVVTGVPEPADCLEGCDVQFRGVDCPEHGVKAFVAAGEWGELP